LCRLNALSAPNRSTTTRASRSEQGGKTTLTITVLYQYQSQEIRNAVIESGMEHGAAECYDKLAELLASLGIPGMERGARA
jgi:uncharacterized protein YndB with AHSA1/START domain